MLSKLPNVDVYEDVIQLMAPLQLNPPVSIYIKSDSPYRVTLIKGNGVGVDAGPHSITKITSLRPLIIASSAPLKSAFVEGWNRLPAELKILTLGFNMKAWNRVGAGDKKAYPPIVLFQLLRHLVMTREIAAIAQDIFYTKNEFHLEPSYQHEWSKLAKLANGSYGFTALRNVVVEFDMRLTHLTNRAWTNFLTQTIGDGISFHCTGSVRFLAPQQAKDRSSELSFEDVKEMFNGKIRFAVEETRAEGQRDCRCI